MIKGRGVYKSGVYINPEAGSGLLRLGSRGLWVSGLKGLKRLEG